MTLLDFFGLTAVTLMLAFYALEERNKVYVLAFSGACVLGSGYGFIQGAWPFGVIEAVWAFVAARRWKKLKRSDEGGPMGSQKKPFRNQIRELSTDHWMIFLR